MTPPTARRNAGIIGVLVALALATGGCAELETAGAPTRAPTRAPTSPSKAVVPTVKPAGKHRPRARHRPRVRVEKPARVGTAAAQLATLRVAGRAPMTGYDRDRFGQAWLDADRNGCDTRNDILNRDLRAITRKDGTNDCVVLTGVLPDPYTGRPIDFVRGESYSVDIDHVVALGNAWASGAWRWDIRERAALANDPLNLLAVDAGANRSKGDSNAASWLPPNKPYRCAYVARQVAVKAKYHLAVTPSEKAQIGRQLSTCPGLPATRDATHAPTRVDHDITDPGDPAQAEEKATPKPRPPAGNSNVYYENCDAARAAGAAPVRRGDPGYGPHLDRDGDGVACE